MLEYTGCDAVMVARGAQGNPWLFRQISELLNYGEVRTNPTPKERLEVALSHVERLVSEKGESRGIKEARKHIAWYIKGMRGASVIKTEIFRISDFATMQTALTNYIDNML
jgi:tRNA-dihydrouridine synthase